MNKVQHVKWCMKQTKLTSEISCPTDACLAQLVRHWPEDLEVLVSIPTGGNFWRNFFALPCVKICQIIWQKRLSRKTQMATLGFKLRFWNKDNSPSGQSAAMSQVMVPKMLTSPQHMQMITDINILLMTPEVDLVGAPPPSPGPNLSEFHVVFGKFCKIISWYPQEGWSPCLMRITDPPPDFKRHSINVCKFVLK